MHGNNSVKVVSRTSAQCTTGTRNKCLREQGLCENKASLGIGLLDWNSHIKAMRVKWLLTYLDASVSTWKLILDCWFARTSLGRAAILTSIPAKVLTKSMRGNIALPQFWSQALDALHELKLTQTSLSRDGMLSQPIWDNRHRQCFLRGLDPRRVRRGGVTLAQCRDRACVVNPVHGSPTLGKEWPRAPQDVAGRGTPKRKGLRKDQVRLTHMLGLCLKRFLRKFRVGWVAHGARWAAGIRRTAWHRATIGGRELLSGATHRWARATRKRYTLAATLRDTDPVPDDPSALTPLFPVISPSLFLIQAALAGGWFKSCVHYNSLRLGLENLGENVEPSYVRVYPRSPRLPPSALWHYG
eukprot:scaffold1640_cov111-Isochrysis_galbana.AAC.29